jgi:hypothetical protein
MNFWMVHMATRSQEIQTFLAAWFYQRRKRPPLLIVEGWPKRFQQTKALLTNLETSMTQKFG